MTELNEIAAALAKAQCEMTNPSFDAANPHFKNKFASLAAVRNSVVPVLAKHGISLMQNLTTAEGVVSCETILTHASGQQIRLGPLTLPVSKEDAQGYGSAATYARRYSMMAVAGVVGDADDDGEGAVGRSDKGKDDSGKPSGWKSQDTRKVTEYRERILEAVREGADLKAVDIWKEVKDEHDFATALWVTIPATIKTMIKNNMDK